MRRPIARDQNQRKRAVSSQVGSWVQLSVSSWINFLPLRFGPSLWLDAADTTTITESGGSVSQWNDKSGFDRHVAQGTGANQPTTGTRTVNGLNGLDFDGSTDRLVAPSNSTLVNSWNGFYTAFAVVVPDSVTGVRAILNADTIAGARTPQFLRFSGTTAQTIRVSNFAGAISTVTASLTSAATIGSTALLCGVLTDSTIRIGVNNVFGTSTAATGGALATAVPHMVGTINNADLFDGIICEIIAYPNYLDLNQIQQVTNYLAAKWGVAI